MSSLYILATGTLIADPQRREGTKGLFATGAIRVEAGEPTIISVIAFGDTAGRLPELAKGDAIAVSARAGEELGRSRGRHTARAFGSR